MTISVHAGVHVDVVIFVDFSGELLNHRNHVAEVDLVGEVLHPHVEYRAGVFELPELCVVLSEASCLLLHWIFVVQLDDILLVRHDLIGLQEAG